jgi:hypothetical protein
MESNRRHPEDRDSRYRAENHRVGQDLYRRDQQNQIRHPQERYQSGQSYHNRDEGHNQDQIHYGSRPDSAYRNPNINFGDQPYRQNQDYRDERSSYARREGTSTRSPYPEDFTRPEQHHHDQTWNERNRYKDDDYRYRSGHRDTWRQFNDADHEEDDLARQRGDYHGREEGFFDRIGNSISHAWRNMTQDEDEGPSGNESYRNRNFNRGHESGPRWADESENDRYRQRRFYRDDSDRY